MFIIFFLLLCLSAPFFYAVLVQCLWYGKRKLQEHDNRKPATYFTSFRLHLVGGKLKIKKKKGHLILVWALFIVYHLLQQYLIRFPFVDWCFCSYLCSWRQSHVKCITYLCFHFQGGDTYVEDINFFL